MSNQGGLYILLGKEIFPTNDFTEWSLNLSTIENVGIQNFQIDGESISVSTVFLGINHSRGGELPILFETMVFGGKYDGYQERYSTYDDALLGHEKVCYLVNIILINREEKLKKLGLN